jgi:hypothetical protein
MRRTKSLLQFTQLQSSIDNLARAATYLRDAGEPSLAMAVLSLRQRADLARLETRVAFPMPATEPAA